LLVEDCEIEVTTGRQDVLGEPWGSLHDRPALSGMGCQVLVHGVHEIHHEAHVWSPRLAPEAAADALTERDFSLAPACQDHHAHRGHVDADIADRGTDQ